MVHLLPYFCHFLCEKDALSETKVIKSDANQLSTLHLEYQPMLLVFAVADWCSVAFFLTRVPLRVIFEILRLSLLKHGCREGGLLTCSKNFKMPLLRDVEITEGWP